MSVRGILWGTAIGAFLWLMVGALVVGMAHAEGQYTSDDVDGWIQAYSAEYATPGYPYSSLVTDAQRVARCESDHFDSRVINNARRGAYGEVGTFQFLPGPHSIFWSTPSAAVGYDFWDPEANVAGAVWLISRGYGPRNWSCW